MDARPPLIAYAQPAPHAREANSRREVSRAPDVSLRIYMADSVPRKFPKYTVLSIPPCQTPLPNWAVRALCAA